MSKESFNLRIIIIFLFGAAVFTFLMLPLLVNAQTGELPPRGENETPTATSPPPAPTSTPIPENVSGGRLQLHIHYGPNWLWHIWAWQELWTVVEWSDGENWHIVEGWRGTPDNIERVEYGHWVSQKEWWVSAHDLNTGPFRWAIYLHEGDPEPLSISDEFYLPTYSGETVLIEQTIGE